MASRLSPLARSYGTTSAPSARMPSIFRFGAFPGMTLMSEIPWRRDGHALRVVAAGERDHALRSRLRGRRRYRRPAPAELEAPRALQALRLHQYAAPGDTVQGP